VILYPAIDLKDGHCVRLRQGDMAQATVFNDEPAAQAKVFESCGFQWLHLVDLNGAIAGRSVNASAIRSILSTIKIPVQLGGGIRDQSGLEGWLEAGITRVILGTAALKNPALIKDSARAYPGRVAVGIDAREGNVAVQGWAEQSTLPALELAMRFEDAGVAALIFTDIGRDGMLGGVNVDATSELARAISIPVIASGGANSVRDIERLVDADGPIAGLVIGRALYDSRIEPAAALRAAAQGKN
jgi:phosphoribosylformimino-5-aminoimidazole carboxamide ribotide isomerase